MSTTMNSVRGILSENFFSLVVVCLVFVGAINIPPRLVEVVKLWRFPLVGKERSHAARVRNYMVSAYGAYEEARAQFQQIICRLTTVDGDYLIIPDRYLDELRLRPDTDVDVSRPFFQTLENKYTGVFPEISKTLLVNHVVKSDLIRSLTRINPRLVEEVERTVKAELPASAEWASVNIYSAILQIVAVVSGHIFLGPELCHAPEYIRAAVDYTVDITTAARRLKECPKWTRPLMALILPEFVRLRQHRRDMRAILGPVITQRRGLIHEGQELPDDMLSWMLEKTEKQGITSIADITDMQLLLTMAAIHTTTLTATRILYDLTVLPDVITALRSEIRTVLATSDNVLTTKALFDMKLMDSVMRESQRLNPPFADGFRRYTLKPLTLKDGTQIPAHCYIAAPNGPIMKDPTLYPEPDTFNPYRFFHLRTTDAQDPIGYKNREQYQFVSVTKENMSFGFGRHACPGRFFAANEIKLILSRLLLDYDIKMPDGVRGTYENFHFGAINATDPTKEILLRKAS